ncbi:MAG: RnfABCDGE type electron transport complex subunit B [Pseudomonadales bacterium]|jgi:electron transport complex protein RnfB|nr:RnfABCDGE type electron transport complex subunit B [Pseudomonadales bacterium]MDP6826705.1 RnfABCDGE type electron transport complex subunit B [Pseudomonadales bacterium]MDP6969934.1 RnfABCDGE type electron transport complex subunit B [Pseudomonadales bacterium]
MDLISALLTLGGLGLAAGTALTLASKRLPESPDEVANAVNALLPQTQCAQCGYPGCKPYAEAVAHGEAIDFCPPGGEDTHANLARLLGKLPGTRLPASRALKARIMEPQCIGCALCINACPVDAIVGAQQLMHTVLDEQCMGCELCVPVCPMGCIELIEVRTIEPQEPRWDSTACIQCGRCAPVCPPGLDPAALLWEVRASRYESAAQARLEDCIDCNRCDRVCPSAIPLTQVLANGKRELFLHRQTRERAARSQARYEARAARLAGEAAASAARRAARVSNQRDASDW